MSDFVKQNATKCKFNTSENWVISNEFVEKIKEKIEKCGVPLSKWNIRINRGILTGLNEAFIIDGPKRQQLIDEDSKSAEIIRPILRGRDIKRYEYDYSDLYLITTFPAKNINIDEYPAIKNYFLSNFGMQKLEQTGKVYIDEFGNHIKSRKKTCNKWFETQDSICYWDDFSKPKIIYSNMTTEFSFLYDEDGFLTNQKCFIITGECLGYLCAFLNSALFNFAFKDNFPKLGKDGRELSKIFFDKIPVLKVNQSINSAFLMHVKNVQENIRKGLPTQDEENIIDEMIFDLYGINSEERRLIKEGIND